MARSPNRPFRLRRPRGQSAVESALVLPLVLFVILGTLQLGLIQNARALNQYAAFMAVRTGAVSYGNCNRMMHSAFAALLPAIEAYTKNGPPATAMANAFAARFTPPATFKYVAGRDMGHDGDVIWIRRIRPLIGDVAAATAAVGQNDEFDDPMLSQPRFTLEAEVVFWYPLNVPFANWIISRMMMAHWGLIAFVERNPIVNNGQKVDWGQGSTTPPFDAAVTAELVNRVLAKKYELPLRATYTMTMMTPVKGNLFLTQNCPPSP